MIAVPSSTAKTGVPVGFNISTPWWGARAPNWVLPYRYEGSMTVLKSGENGCWKGKRCWVIQKSSVDLHDGADKAGGGENSATECDFTVTFMATFRGNPPHKLLARFVAGGCTDGKVFVWTGWEEGIRDLMSNSWLAPVAQADRINAMISRVIVMDFIT